jgi:hypothetical protein
MVLSTISNQSDWTLATDETEIGWDYFDELLTQIGAPGNGQTATQAIGNTKGNLTKIQYDIEQWTATSSGISLGGTSINTLPAANAADNVDFLFSGSTNNNLVVTGAAATDHALDDIEVYELGGCKSATVGATGGPIMIDSIVDEQVGVPYVLDYSGSPLYSKTGFLVYATSGGASVKLNMNMVYEII